MAFIDRLKLLLTTKNLKN